MTRVTTLAAITLSAVLVLTITGRGARQAETTGGKSGELALATSKLTGTLMAFYDGPASKLDANMTIEGEPAVLRLVDEAMFSKLPADEKARLKTEKTGRIVRSEQTQLDGVPVNHYFVEFDVKKQIDLSLGNDVPADQRSKIEKRLEGKDLRVPAELWLNAEQAGG